MTTKILIIGGYGAVGREVVAALPASGYEILVTGRHPSSARPVPGATLVRYSESLLDEVDVVLACAEPDIGVASAVLRRGKTYLDITADPARIAALEELGPLAREHHGTAVLSVGLVPGVSNLLAASLGVGVLGSVGSGAGVDSKAGVGSGVGVLEVPVPGDGVRGAGGSVDIGVMLGAGERHGPAALAWTLDNIGRRSGSWKVRFPGYGTRTVHRFPFSDQDTLPRTLGLSDVRTGLCLDSRPLTRLMGSKAAGRFLRTGPMRAVMGRVHLGSDRFAVTAVGGGRQATFSGRRQTRATGVVAARLVTLASAFPVGVAHVEQLVEPVPFLRSLTDAGYDLRLPE